MEVNRINTQTFCANNQNQNNYNKTYVGRGIGLGVSAGCIAEKIVSRGGLKNLLEDARENFTEQLNKSQKCEWQKFEMGNLTPELRKIAHNDLAGSLAVLTVACVGAGAIVDAMINSSRRKKANESARWD